MKNEMIVKLTWDEDLGRDWMNIFNLDLCLFTEQHTKKELLRVEKV